MPLKELITKNKIVTRLEFHDPTSGYHYNANYSSIENLIAHVSTYRKINKLETIEIEDLRLMIEDYLCSKPGMENYCIEKKQDVTRTFEQYLTGAKTYLKAALQNMVGSTPFEHQEMAVKRALMCAKCPHNSKATKNSSILQKMTDFLMKKQTDGRSTEYDKVLGACSICGCNLPAKVHYKRAMIESSIKPHHKERLPNNTIINNDGEKFICWQLKEPK